EPIRRKRRDARLGISRCRDLPDLWRRPRRAIRQTIQTRMVSDSRPLRRLARRGKIAAVTQENDRIHRILPGSLGDLVKLRAKYDDTEIAGILADKVRDKERQLAIVDPRSDQYSNGG